jgi:hypothetical protein
MRRLLMAVAAAAALVAVPAALADNKYDVREVPYVEPPAPGPDETRIYVFREKGDLAGLRKFAMIDNDTVVAVLEGGTFSHFLVPSGQHEIVAYVSPSPLLHFRVTPAPGKTVYLNCKAGYTSGMFMTTLDEDAAKALIAKLKYTEIGKKGEKAKMDYKAYYDNLYK